jgi:anti-anti-sigma factor
MQRLASAEDQSVVVTFPDEIDLANADYFADRLAAACRPGVTTVVADLTRTSFCDARGARMLAQAYWTAFGNDTALRFVIPDPWIHEVLHVAGVAGLLDIYPSLNQSLLLAARGLCGTRPAPPGAVRRGRLRRPIPASTGMVRPAGWAHGHRLHHQDARLRADPRR